MNLPKLDTYEEQQRKRFERSREDLLLLLEKLSDEEYTLNYYGNYLGSEQLFEAKKHLTSAYHLTRKYLVSKGENLDDVG